MLGENADFYREVILDHARNRHNWGLLNPADFDHEESNPLCGDYLHLTLRLDEKGVIREVGWDGQGCAISQASASMLGDELIGKTLQQAQQVKRDEVLDLVGLKLTPNRMKCALLPLKVLVVGAEGVSRWEQIEDEG
jgi:nitrogen fixation protein NifU and related proteins